MNLIEGILHGNLIPTLEDQLESRSILLGYPFHLTHHLLNHPFPPEAYKTWLIPMDEREKSYADALMFWPNIG